VPFPSLSLSLSLTHTHATPTVCLFFFMPTEGWELVKHNYRRVFFYLYFLNLGVLVKYPDLATNMTFWYVGCVVCGVSSARTQHS
jgi:hypothetical protein